MLWKLATAVLLAFLVAVAAPVRPRGGGVGHELLVIDRETRAPVGGCELRWLDEARIAALARPRGESREETLRRFGQVARTDARGRAWLPGWGPEGLIWLDARAGERHEHTHFWGKPARASVIELEREVELRIEVRDAAGAPEVAVPVAVMSERDTLATAWTDDVGVARPRLPRRLLDAHEALVAAFAFPTRAGRGRALDEAARAGAPVRLELPPTGGVAFELLSPAGARKPIELDLNVRRRVAHGEPQPATWHVRVTDGRGLLEPCELGVPLEVWGRPLGVLGMVPLERVPTEPGELVGVRFVVPDARVEVAARVLRPDGRPLRDARVTIERTHGGSGPGREQEARTDGQGRLVVHDDPWSAQAPLTRLLVHHRDAKRSVFEGAAEFGADRKEPIELGDLRLEEVPLAARGRVVDGEARPLPGVRVSLREEHPQGWARTPRRTTVTTGPDGEFELHARLEHPAYDVEASAPGLVSPCPERIGDPARPLELELYRPVRVEGRLRLADVPTIAGLSVALFDPRRNRTYAKRGLRPDGAFALEGVPPGEHVLWIELRGVGPLARFPLSVPRVDVFRPEELADFDLSSLYRELALAVVDGEGRPVEVGVISARPEEGGRAYLSEQPLDGQLVRFMITARPVTVEVSAPGFRPFRKTDVSDDAHLVLEPDPSRRPR